MALDLKLTSELKLSLKLRYVSKECRWSKTSPVGVNKLAIVPFPPRDEMEYSYSEVEPAFRLWLRSF